MKFLSLCDELLKSRKFGALIKQLGEGGPTS